ncbi:hypothetical protein BN1232_01371 [Mycobacterium lentiflavum]|uniref:Uncharacterized protein n=1 Tax=Mycobacterium lentiflavum TaxID=141349 RepID=A0A0E3WBL4_MYCLN|nr:hypothetical protein BN1232_01371 [Mycobacterium lentiflavum]
MNRIRARRIGTVKCVRCAAKTAGVEQNSRTMMDRYAARIINYQYAIPATLGVCAHA